LSALELAQHYRERLAPLCERIELTGPLRRRRFNWRAPMETPLEFLAIPKREQVPAGLGGLPAFERNLLHAVVLDWVAAREFMALGLEGAGPPRIRYRLLNDTCELVLWLAERRNFGSLWLWRTGSRAHTEWLCERARRRRACWLPRAGLCTGLRAYAVEEADLYRELGLRFIPPEAREPGQYEAGQFDLPEEVES
jgi:hypothetical protein